MLFWNYENVNGSDGGAELVAVVTRQPLQKESDSLFNAGMATGSRSPGNTAEKREGHGTTLSTQPNQPGDRKSAGRKSVEENVLRQTQNSEY